MSGDHINQLKMVKEQPLNFQDLEYTKRLLEPFEDLTIERFGGTSSSTISTPSSSTKPNLFYLLAIGLVLIINFPTVRSKSGLNEYILWLISAVILLLVLY
jgi:hypothetical protein